MKKIIFTIVGAASLIFVAGCGHNVWGRGVGVATPWGAFGSGEFGIVKDNVKIESNEKTTQDGYKKTGIFEVGNQTTGYEAEVEKVKAKN